MRVRSDSLPRRAFVAALALMLTGCAARSGPFVWVDRFEESAERNGSYAISVGDLLAVQVWDHDEMSARPRVREDGRISVPLLSDIAAAGMTPDELGRAVERELKAKGLVVSPRVTVSVEARSPLKIAVLGEVMRPGLYELDPGAGLAQALASAGGLSPFAHKDRLFVVRRGREPVRIRFTFDALAGVSGRASSFRLKAADVVVVE